MLRATREVRLTSWVEFFMNVFESVLVHMGVDLGGGNISVAKHHLHCTKVCSVAEQVGSKGVS